jgi:hypothetical protein
MATHTQEQRLEQVLRGQHVLMDEVHQWLAEEQKHDDILRAVVLSSRKEQPACIPDLDATRIFDKASIRAMCVKYRLRFLDAGLFKGELPAQAIHAVRQLERQAGEPLRSFKVMAPAERFRLTDSEVDPLLFVPLGEDRYYLVHKWGKDLRWYRSLLGWPFRSPVQLGAMVLAVALVLTCLMPTKLITMDPGAGFWGAHRILFLFWSTMVVTSFTVFGWFAFFGQFSTQAWNSKYFN